VEGDQGISILLADGHALFREAVKAVLESEPGLRVVAEARDGQQAVTEANTHRPDVALLDIDLPNCDGIRATSLIVDSLKSCRVIVVANEEEEGTLAQAIEAGASGYLTKECPMTELIGATRAVHRGETLIPNPHARRAADPAHTEAAGPGCSFQADFSPHPPREGGPETSCGRSGQRCNRPSARHQPSDCSDSHTERALQVEGAFAVGGRGICNEEQHFRRAGRCGAMSDAVCVGRVGELTTVGHFLGAPSTLGAAM
jgi:DNA-binding NarL/FixJ family response regulator